MHPYFENRQDYIRISHGKESYNYPAHFHKHLEIFFCFSGREKVKVGETVYTLKKGDAVVIFPNTVHEYIKCDEVLKEPTETVAIILTNKLIEETLPEIISKYPKNPFIDSSLISRDTLLSFKRVLTAKDSTELIGWTCIVLSNLIRVLELNPTNASYDLPSEIISYIDLNFKEDLSIEYISKIFGYHPSYIAHIFCDQLKIPFRTYLGSVRSEYAASQIKTSKKSLTEIAYESGFNSLNTFCRCFKKHFSKTPSQYKKEVR